MRKAMIDGVEELLTADEFAQASRMSLAWVRRQILEKTIKTCRIGRRVFIPQSVLVDLINAGMSEPPQAAEQAS